MTNVLRIPNLYSSSAAKVLSKRKPFGNNALVAIYTLWAIQAGHACSPVRKRIDVDSSQEIRCNKPNNCSSASSAPVPMHMRTVHCEAICGARLNLNHTMPTNLALCRFTFTHLKPVAIFDCGRVRMVGQSNSID